MNYNVCIGPKYSRLQVFGGRRPQANNGRSPSGGGPRRSNADHTKFGSLKLKLKFKLKIRPEMTSRYRICTKSSLTYSTSIESVQVQLQLRVEM